MARRLVGPVLLVLAVSAGAALAVEPDEVLKDPALETRARALSAELRCMVCQNQSIDDLEAPLAKDLRILVRERLAAGDSDGQVKDFLTARYGDFVLLKPPFGWRTAIAWLGPFAIVLAGLAAFLLRRRRSSADAIPLTAQEASELERLVDTRIRPIVRGAILGGGHGSGENAAIIARLASMLARHFGPRDRASRITLSRSTACSVPTKQSMRSFA